MRATLLAGYGVASGKGGDPRFPGGTLAMQLEPFRLRGLDLSRFYRGTLNLSIAPHGYRVQRPTTTLRGVRWHPVEPAEDFSFFDCRLVTDDGRVYEGLIYYPHPDTKPDHVQPDDVLEVLAERIEGIGYGDGVWLELVTEQIELIEN